LCKYAQLSIQKQSYVIEYEILEPKIVCGQTNQVYWFEQLYQMTEELKDFLVKKHYLKALIESDIRKATTIPQSELRKFKKKITKTVIIKYL